MAKTLASKLKVQLVSTYANTDDFGTNYANLDKLYELETTNGTGSGNADLHFRDTRSINASSSENIDLAASLSDAFGATLTFVKVKKIVVKAASTNGGNIVVGGAGANTFTGPFSDATDKIKVAPGGIFVIYAPASGWTVTAGTGDILLVANDDSGAAGSYDIIIEGTSA